MTDLVMSLTLKADRDNRRVLDLANTAMEEVRQMAVEKEPLWKYDPCRNLDVLNKDEHTRRFRELEFELNEAFRAVVGGLRRRRMVEVEGTRDFAFLPIPPICVAKIMMDVKLWSFVFSDMLSRANVLEVISPGDPTTLDGALQVMNVEYHAPTPLVPVREEYSARYCRHSVASNTWLVVEASMDEIVSNPLANFTRQPSGCMIEGLANGSTKITWIEHVEVDNHVEIHPLFKQLISSSYIFGAKSWLNQLTRQCHHLNTVTRRSISTLRFSAPGNQSDKVITVDALLKLCHRMRKDFHGNLSGSNAAHKWKPIPHAGRGPDTFIRPAENTSSNANRYPVILCVAKSFWLPSKAMKVFSYLQNEKNRCEWDMLACDSRAERIFHLQAGPNSERSISAIKMLGAKTNLVETVILQEACCKDSNWLYVAYTPVTSSEMGQVINGHDSDDIAIIPSGFVIHPGGENLGGSVVTLLFQLYDRDSTMQFVPPESVAVMYSLVDDTVSTLNTVLPRLPL